MLDLGMSAARANGVDSAFDIAQVERNQNVGTLLGYIARKPSQRIACKGQLTEADSSRR
jgi:hypothetical protein